MEIIETTVWLTFIVTVIGLWLAGFWLIVRGVQQYLLAKPRELTRSLVGRGAGLVLAGSAVAEIAALLIRL